MEKMKKKFKNSILIEGDYNFNYLCNLLFISQQCLIDSVLKYDSKIKRDKKITKQINNLCAFFESSIEIFSRLSKEFKEEEITIHSVDYSDEHNVVASADSLLSHPVQVAFDKDKFYDLSEATASTVEDIRKAFDSEIQDKFDDTNV